jgi:hypothetical protein
LNGVNGPVALFRVPEGAQVFAVLVENGGHGAPYTLKTGESTTWPFIPVENPVNFKAGFAGFFPQN